MIHAVEPRSPAWFALRAGRVTGTSAADVLATLKSGGEAAARRDLRARLVVERITGTPVDTGAGFQSAEMRWGVEHERAARHAYDAATGAIVRSIGFVSHDTIAAGCSPDGLVYGTGDNPLLGLVEVKCPKSATHLATLMSPKIPPEYAPQILHNCWITGAVYCDFVSFDPRFPPDVRLVVVRTTPSAVERDAYELAVRILLGDVDRAVDELNARRGGMVAA